MGDWKKWVEEESEYQWLSFVAFTIFIIVGGILVNLAGNLPGISPGSTLGTQGRLLDSSESLSLWDSDDGRFFLDAKSGAKTSMPFATCVEENSAIRFVCSGIKSQVWIDSGEGLNSFTTSTNRTIIDASIQGTDIMMISSNGIKSGIIGMKALSPSTASPEAVGVGGDFNLDTIIATGEGKWMAGGGWNLPGASQSSSAATPLAYEVVVEITWSNVSLAPLIQVIHVGGQGAIHYMGILADGNILAAGTSGAIIINGMSTSEIDVRSTTAVIDKNGGVWFFGTSGEENIGHYTNGELMVEKLSKPLSIEPDHAFIDADSISVHGISSDNTYEAMTIDTNAKNSLLSLRGVIDFLFIITSLVIIGLMFWNVAEAISKGEVF
tara:strand:+ start:1250 stop:2392 length:1143 start_codon:yes stop_codon:yes gene_type:complete